tara:strand:+ start:1450 stop:1629 length:180 start_codon:yes stop_codon:yes gene_type:complete
MKAIINIATNEVVSRGLNDTMVNFLFNKFYRKGIDTEFTAIEDKNLSTTINENGAQFLN